MDPTTKVGMLEYIRKHVEIMQPLLTETGLPDDYLTLPPECDDFKIDWIRPATKWIKTIYMGPYNAAACIKCLLPKEIWDRYKNWGDFDEHRESVLLREKLVILKKACRAKDRPDIFKKGKRDGEIEERSNGKAKANRKKCSADSDGSETS